MKYVLLALLIFSSNALAVLPFEDAVAPELITSGRALAMGNAYMSKVDDGWSAFYNPAGLGTVRGLQFHIGNLHLETNNGFLDITGGSGSFFESSGNYLGAFKPATLKDLHTATPGRISHAKVQLFPNITYRGITVGYMYAKQSRGRLRTTTSDFEISERVDQGPVMALSASIFGGILKFGASAVYLTRTELQKDFAPAATVSITEATDYKKGSMVNIVAGTRITLPVTALPTLSLVIRNSSMQGWDTPEFAGVPDEIPQTIDAGFSITPNMGRTSRIHIEVAAKDIGNRYKDVQNRRKIQGGIEFDYKRTMFVRFGFSDGWGSGGVGVRTKSFIFDLSTYAIESSDDGYREEEDRRTLISMSKGF